MGCWWLSKVVGTKLWLAMVTFGSQNVIEVYFQHNYWSLDLGRSVKWVVGVYQSLPKC